MGDITTRAKDYVEAQQAALYAPPPSTPSPTPEQAAAETRRENLLGRDRGRFGTVKTGFRGLLDLALPFGRRKTLLGE